MGKLRRGWGAGHGVLWGQFVNRRTTTLIYVKYHEVEMCCARKTKISAQPEAYSSGVMNAF